MSKQMTTEQRIEIEMNQGRMEKGLEPLIKCADGVWRQESTWRFRCDFGLEG